MSTEMEAGRIGLRFVAISEPVSMQVEGQGYTLPEPVARQCQADADAITRLSIRGVLTEVEVRAARKRLLKRVAALATPTPTQTDG